MHEGEGFNLSINDKIMKFKIQCKIINKAIILLINYNVICKQFHIIRRNVE